MAEFCKDCFAKYISPTPCVVDHAILSKELDLCEGCGEYKHVVVRISRLPKFVVKLLNRNKESDRA